MPEVRVNKFFVSDAEGDFFRVLVRVVGNRGHVLAQVSLKQLLWLPGNNQSNPGRTAWQNKIDRRSIDFVVCDPATLKPLLAIELDEPTHERADRKARDQEVYALLKAAALPCLRLPTRRNYDTRELATAVLPYLVGRN